MLSCRPLYLALFTIVLLHLRQSTPYPVPDKQEALGSRTTCDAIDTYSVEWFLANTLPEHRHEIYDHALFYPRGTSDAARKLAKKSNGEYVTIWVVWPCWLYNDEQVPENKLRCIHRDKKVRQKFYENMSEAFARMARSSATVMHSTKDYAKPPEDGIWARTELEALVEKTNVDKIRKIDETAGRRSTWEITGAALEQITNAILKAVEFLGPGWWNDEQVGETG